MVAFALDHAMFAVVLRTDHVVADGCDNAQVSYLRRYQLKETICG
jgi:hypothetical protein